MAFITNIYKEIRQIKLSIACIMSLILHLSPVFFLLQQPEKLEVSENIIEVELLKIPVQTQNTKAATPVTEIVAKQQLMAESQPIELDQFKSNIKTKPANQTSQQQAGEPENSQPSYEQIITRVIARHKPSLQKIAGDIGVVQIMLQTDRLGNITSVRLEDSTNHPELDQALISMVKSAGPLPPVPINFPSDSLFAFRITIDLSDE